MPIRRPPPSGWQCPDCGRRFIHRTREHSCDLTSLESHLSRTSLEVREVFRAIRGLLDKFGPYKITPVKTMILLSTKSNFGGITFTKSRLDIGLFLFREVRHERIHKIEPVSPRKLAHHIRLSSVAQVDMQLEQWLSEAYHGEPGSSGS
jgi:hypothetical protein